MRYLRAVEYPLIALVLVSLAGKVVTNTADQPQLSAERAFATAVVRELSDSGYQTKVEYWTSGVVVHAQRGACQIWVRDYRPHGTYRNVYEALAKPVGALRYVYKGAVSVDPPKLDPLMRFFFHREMLRLGLQTPKYPIFAVASSEACQGSTIALPASIV